MALAAGVNVLLSPGLTLALDASGALAPDGRCKTFDADADGYVRGEGCAVLVLKTLSRAQRDGDMVLALVLGSAVNQDGRTRGIMAPSGDAQEHVIRAACRSAGLPPGSVDYVETHGTGTTLGDQTEAEALTRVYGADRAAGEAVPARHCEAEHRAPRPAAGAASLIKAVLALGNAEIPPSLNFNTAQPRCGLGQLGAPPGLRAHALATARTIPPRWSFLFRVRRHHRSRADRAGTGRACPDTTCRAVQPGRRLPAVPIVREVGCRAPAVCERPRRIGTRQAMAKSPPHRWRTPLDRGDPTLSTGPQWWRPAARSWPPDCGC